MKILTDEAFEKYEKAEQLVNFLKKEYPYCTDEEVHVLAKAIAAKRVEDLKIDLMKENAQKRKLPAKTFNKKPNTSVKQKKKAPKKTASKKQPKRKMVNV